MKNHIHQSIPPNPENHKFAVVMFNQLGSNTHGDHGRDGDRLSEALNVAVLTVNRPGTDTFDYFSSVASRLKTDIVGEHARVLEGAHKIIEDLGVKAVLLAGRSAGGMSALIGARTEQLPAVGVYAAEPVGWINTSRKEVAKQGREYRKKQADILESSDDSLIKPQPTDTEGFDKVRRLISIPFLAIKDMQRYQDIFGSTISRDSLDFILEKGGIDVSIDFARESMVINDDTFQSIIEDYEQKLRFDSKLKKCEKTRYSLIAVHSAGNELQIQSVQNTVHASFDNRGLFAQLIKPSIERAALRVQ